MFTSFSWISEDLILGGQVDKVCRNCGASHSDVSPSPEKLLEQLRSSVHVWRQLEIEEQERVLVQHHCRSTVHRGRQKQEVKKPWIRHWTVNGLNDHGSIRPNGLVRFPRGCQRDARRISAVPCICRRKISEEVTDVPRVLSFIGWLLRQAYLYWLAPPEDSL